MIEIRTLPGGRYEVYAEGIHQEAFEGCLGAIAVAQALASREAAETLTPVIISTPWGEHSVAVPCRALNGSTPPGTSCLPRSSVNRA